ncbi:hypothetical protein JL720_9884 [Aureococcus anophagefferens]|nr:hypothetical protein JL720_9884 [Aureococcus anophagefferens]
MEIENVESFEESRLECLAQSEGLTIQERDLEAIRSFFDKIFFWAENAIATDGNAPFKALALIFATLVVLFAFAWYYVVKFDSKTGMHPKHLARRSLVSKDDRQDVYGYGDLVDSFWLSLLVLSTGGHDDSLPAIFRAHRLLWGILIGLVIFAILAGFITRRRQLHGRLAKGKSKVIMNGTRRPGVLRP